MRRELERLEEERKRRQKEKKLKKLVSEKAAANDLTYGLVDQSAEKLRRYKYLTTTVLNGREREGERGERRV